MRARAKNSSLSFFPEIFDCPGVSAILKNQGHAGRNGRFYRPLPGLAHLDSGADFREFGAPRGIDDIGRRFSLHSRNLVPGILKDRTGCRTIHHFQGDTDSFPVGKRRSRLDTFSWRLAGVRFFE